METPRLEKPHTIVTLRFETPQYLEIKEKAAVDGRTMAGYMKYLILNGAGMLKK